jgi:hypothetical protein
MDFERHLRNGVNLIKEEPAFFILGGFIVLVLNCLSLGLLAGPLLAPYMLAMVLMLRQNQRPEFNDLQNGFKRFALLFPFIIVEILIILGFVVLIIPGLVLMTWWMYVLPLMADQSLTWDQAMRVSRQKVIEKGFLLHLVFFLIIGVVPGILVKVVAIHFWPFKILELLLMPFQLGCIASLYLEHFDAVEVTSGAEPFTPVQEISAAPEPPQAPPPPPPPEN